MKPFTNSTTRKTFFVTALIAFLCAMFAFVSGHPQLLQKGGDGMMLALPTFVFCAAWIYQTTAVSRKTTLPFLPTYEDIFRVMKARAIIIESRFSALNALLRDTKIDSGKVKRSSKLLKQTKVNILKIEQLSVRVGKPPKTSRAHYGSAVAYLFDTMPGTVSAWKLALEPAEKKLSKLERTLKWKSTACAVQPRKSASA